MTTDLPPHLCEGMRDWLAEVDIPLEYDDTFREYGITVLDGGTSRIHITFCPYCGAELPNSMRDEWYRRLDALGLDQVADEHAIPLDMRTGAWWRRTGQSREPSAE